MSPGRVSTRRSPAANVSVDCLSTRGPATAPDAASRGATCARSAGLYSKNELRCRLLIERMRLAAIQARAAQVEQLTVELAQHSPEAADNVRALTREFRYEELIALLELGDSARAEAKTAHGGN